MTSPSVTLSTSDLRVEPGGQITTTVTIANFSDIVEGFALQVLGEEIAGWTQITPTEVQVYPGQQATAVLAFAPPAGHAATSGTFPFGIRAESVVDPTSSAVAEGDIEVGRVFGLNAAVAPTTSSGRWRSGQLVTVTNWGNAAVTLRVTANDPDEKLAFLLLPDHLTVPVGASASTRVQVRTRRPFLRGTPIRHPFVVAAEPDPPDNRPVTAPSLALDDRRTSINAAFLQKPILSRFVVMAATLVLLALGGGLAYALTRPVTAANPGLTSGPPAAPGLTGGAVDPTTIQLTWDSQPGIDRYQLVAVDGAAVTMIQADIPGINTARTVLDARPGASNCYRLTAVRGQQLGPASQKCVDTPAVAVSAPSSGPTDVSTGVPTDTGTIVVPPVEPGGLSTPASTPAGTSPSTTGEPVSPSPPTTTTGEVTSVPVASTAFTPVQYFLLAATVPDVSANSRQSAVTKQDAIRAVLLDNAYTVGIVDSADYPGLRIETTTKVTVPSIIVYVGTFASAADVDAFCATHRDLGADPNCFSFQPVPAG